MALKCNHTTNKELEMERLKIRFSEATDLKLDDLASKSELNKSDIARAAMAFGIDKIQMLLANGSEANKDFLKVEALKAKQ